MWKQIKQTLANFFDRKHEIFKQKMIRSSMARRTQFLSHHLYVNNEETKLKIQRLRTDQEICDQLATLQECVNVVLKMNKQYEQFIDQVFKVSNSPLLASSKLNEFYYLTAETYDKYGFSAFNSFKGLIQPWWLYYLNFKWCFKIRRLL